MTLDQAIRILAEAHTQDDHKVGFTTNYGLVSLSPYPDAHHEYVQAWKVVREHLGMQISPPTRS